MSLDMVDDMTDLLPVHGKDIATLLDGLCLVVVEEEAFWFECFHSGC